MTIRINKKDYSNGKIYKITSYLTDDIYIGSTTKKLLCQRMTTHRSDYQRWKNGKTNKLTAFDIFDKVGMENCKIELLELFPCSSNDELSAREGYYIRNMVCVNKNIAGRTKKEYREDNKDTISEMEKQYYKDNIDTILERHKQYSKVKVSCGCGVQICQGTTNRHERTIKHQNFMKLSNDKTNVITN